MDYDYIETADLQMANLAPTQCHDPKQQATVSVELRAATLAAENRGIKQRQQL